MTSLRPLFILYFLIHIPSTLVISFQGVFPNVELPPFFRESLAGWIESSQDPFLAPLIKTGSVEPWFWGIIVCELFFQLPLEAWLLVKVWQKEWERIRMWAVVYAVHVITTMVPILVVLKEADVENKGVLWGSYLPFLIVPALFGWAVGLGGQSKMRKVKRG
ncbi:hypothetical protein SpCBS45565_g01918 [Spizellomyces sp. 'palustris']|nr:hypothetical protein SpCBS45565_g01918 [Spizellomyces sp. 'palustris']